MTANNSTQTSNPAQGTQASTAAAPQATGSAASIPASVSTATRSSSSAISEPALLPGIIDSANPIGVAQTSLLNLAQSLAGMFTSISRNMAVCNVEVLIVKSHSFHRF